MACNQFFTKEFASHQLQWRFFPLLLLSCTVLAAKPLTAVEVSAHGSVTALPESTAASGVMRRDVKNAAPEASNDDLLFKQHVDAAIKAASSGKPLPPLPSVLVGEQPEQAAEQPEQAEDSRPQGWPSTEQKALDSRPQNEVKDMSNRPHDSLDSTEQKAEEEQDPSVTEGTPDGAAKHTAHTHKHSVHSAHVQQSAHSHVKPGDETSSWSMKQHENVVKDAKKYAPATDASKNKEKKHSHKHANKSANKSSPGLYTSDAMTSADPDSTGSTDSTDSTDSSNSDSTDTSTASTDSTNSDTVAATVPTDDANATYVANVTVNVSASTNSTTNASTVAANGTTAAANATTEAANATTAAANATTEAANETTVAANATTDSGPFSPVNATPAATNATTRAANVSNSDSPASPPPTPSVVEPAALNDSNSHAQFLAISMVVSNVDYSTLAADANLTADFKASVQNAVATEAGNGVQGSSVTVALSPGSVAVSATIATPTGVSVNALQTGLTGSGTLGQTVSAAVTAVPGLATSGPVGVTISSVHLSTATGTPHTTPATAPVTPPPVPLAVGPPGTNGVIVFARTGSIGVAGEAGPMGPAGPHGAAGAPGSSIYGQKGSAGGPGGQGPKGHQGLHGEPGPMGQHGPPGAEPKEWEAWEQLLDRFRSRSDTLERQSMVEKRKLDRELQAVDERVSLAKVRAAHMANRSLLLAQSLQGAGQQIQETLSVAAQLRAKAEGLTSVDTTDLTEAEELKKAGAKEKAPEAKPCVKVEGADAASDHSGASLQGCPSLLLFVFSVVVAAAAPAAQ